MIFIKREEKSENMEEEAQVAGNVPVNLVDFRPGDFGWEVERWLQS